MAGQNTLTTLATFNGVTATGPFGPLIRDAQGNLYGTAYRDSTGPITQGSVFELKAGSSTITTLASFNASPIGAFPIGSLLMDAKGNLYGTAVGTANDTVFEISAGSNAVTTLATLNSSGGFTPYGGLIMDGQGNLFGTEGGLGQDGDDAAFEIAAGTNALTIFATFSGPNGKGPNGLIMDAQGNFYGTTVEGGLNGYGTVFEITPVPEPSSLALLALGAIALSLHRGRRVWSAALAA